jgi:hypothetical protein
VEQGGQAVRHALDLGGSAISPVLPNGIYTIPEVSMVGETEESLQRHGTSIRRRLLKCADSQYPLQNRDAERATTRSAFREACLSRGWTEGESISNWGLRGLLLNLRLLFSLHSRIPTNEGLPELVIEYLRPHLE